MSLLVKLKKTRIRPKLDKEKVYNHKHCQKKNLTSKIGIRYRLVSRKSNQEHKSTVPQQLAKSQTETQKFNTDMTGNRSGDDNFHLSSKTTTQIEAMLVRDETTNEHNMPSSSRIVQKR